MNMNQSKTGNVYAVTFSNGFSYIHDKNPCMSDLSIVYVLCKVGTAQETDENQGIAHLLEHMLFTSKSGNREAQNMFSTFDSMGVKFEAFTTKEFTIFSLSCLPKYVSTCVQLLADVILNSDLTSSQIETERSVIREENIQEMNDLRSIAYDTFTKYVFFQPKYRRPVDAIDNYRKFHFTVDDVQKFYDTFYKSTNIIVSICSPETKTTVQRYMKQSAFGTSKVQSKSHKRNQSINQATFKELVRQYHRHKPTYVSQKTELENAYLIIGFAIPGYGNRKAKSIFDFIKYHLNRLDGPLFRILRTQQGKAYKFFAETEYQETQGFFAIHVYTSDESLMSKNGKIVKNRKDMMYHVLSILQNLKEEPISTEEMKTTKEHIKHMLEMKSADESVRADYNARELFASRINEQFVPYSSIYSNRFARLQNTTVHKYIRSFLQLNDLVVTIASKNPPSENRVMRILSSVLD